jgi:NtrC-family two-component system response regulator AlgB
MSGKPSEPAAGGPRLSALVIDDEKNIRKTLTVCLEGIGCRVASAGTPAEALAAMERDAFDLAFLDLRLGESDGLDLLPRLLAGRPELAVVVVTAFATFETAVEAMRRGAVDYLPKPFSPAEIRHAVEQAQRWRAMRHQLSELEERLAREVPEADLTTESPAMRATLELVGRAAASEAPILLRGESGTGKGVLARSVHLQSPRREGPFVTVNCPTLSEELLASELFGHVQGSFTGAVRDQAGKVEAADRGTLFLDEIGELSPGLQAKLLRFLQDKQFERLGETRTRRADVRVVAATNRDLEADVRTGHFREDLLFRLNVIEVPVPPLRERHEDISRLAREFLRFFGAGKRPLELTSEAEAALLAYPWPGNVRELRNVIERAVILSPGSVLGREALPQRIAAQAHGGPRLGGEHTLEQIEREHIERVLARAGTAEAAARTLGIDVSTLWRKRKKYEGG